MNRNMSVFHYFQELAKEHQPIHRFKGTSRQDWQQWRERLLPALHEALGEMPAKIPLESRVIAQWQQDGLVKQKIEFNVEKHLAATAYLFRPEQIKGKLPAIIACHGHGAYGKESVMGNRATPEMAANIALHNYDYGLQMAQAGFVTIAIDWRGFGQRNDKTAFRHFENDSRDICNLLYLHATLLGRTVLGMDVHDASCAIDLLCQQDFVDAERIGVMGLSFGGTMTTWISLCDPRIKATDIICYSDRFAKFAIADFNYCGSQIVPGLYKLCDVPDLQGLIAPRPLLVEIGVYDDCFNVDSAMSCYHEVEKIYQAAGVADKLHLDLFQGGHSWGANKSVEFFKRYLS